jgi:hypothetical protein
VKTKSKLNSTIEIEPLATRVALHPFLAGMDRTQLALLTDCAIAARSLEGEPTCVGFVVSSSKLAFLCMILHRNGFTRQTSRFMYARISGCVSWLNRSHSMSDPPNITSDGDGLVAEFPITYALTNSKGTSSGTLRITMHLKPQAQTWQVAGIQKEAIQATMKH